MDRLQRTAALAMTAFSLLFALPLHADPRVAMSLRDLDSGRPLELVDHGGDRYVAGAIGHRYAIGLHNLTPRRVLVVLSVDGVNAVTGETASPEQSGYVLGPYQRSEVRGWRKSLAEVAEFEFSSLPASYAARTDRPDNVGVIGIAVFDEHSVPTWRDRLPLGRADRVPAPAAPATAQRSEAAAGAADSAAPAQEKQQSLGTGHGERRYDPAQHTAFQRASRQPSEVQRVFYDSRENLIAAGVLPPDWPQPRTRPDPFPVGFVPDPY